MYINKDQSWFSVVRATYSYQFDQPLARTPMHSRYLPLNCQQANNACVWNYILGFLKKK